MATEIRYASNVLRHDNHTAPSGTLTQRTPTVPFNHILVVNVDSANAAQLSFDGTNYLNLAKGSSISLDCAKQYSYWTAGVGGTAAIQVLLGAEI